MPAWAFPYAVLDLRRRLRSPLRSSTARSRRTSAASAPMPISTTCSISRRRFITRSIPIRRTIWAPIHLAPGLFDAAPYWRAAFEPHWGNNWLEVGTFGMAADVHPWTHAPATTTTYDFLANGQTTPTSALIRNISIRATIIGSRCAAAISTNTKSWMQASPTDSPPTRPTRSTKRGPMPRSPTATTTGSCSPANTSTLGEVPMLTCTAASGFSPNTNGWIAEIAYIPFISSQAPGWPWFNARIGLQYTWYNEFNGTTVGAQRQQYAVPLSVDGDVAGSRYPGGSR